MREVSPRGQSFLILSCARFPILLKPPEVGVRIVVLPSPPSTCFCTSLASSCLCSLVAFATPIASMSAMFSRATGYARAPFQNLQNHNLYPHTKTPHQQSIQHYGGVNRDTQDNTNDEIFSTFARSTVCRSTETRPKRPTTRSNLPVHFQRWLASSDSDGEDNHPPLKVDQDSMDIDSGHGYTTPDHGRCSHSEPHHTPRGFCGVHLDDNELLEEDLRSIASQYLNLDFPPPVSVHSSGTCSPSTSIGTPMSPDSITEDSEANRAETGYPWAWEDHTYQSSDSTRYIDEEDYAREHELSRIEATLRVRLTEQFAREAIYGIEKTRPSRRRREKKVKEVRVENSPPIVAFSQLIPGRTIYNP